MMKKLEIEVFLVSSLAVNKRNFFLITFFLTSQIYIYRYKVMYTSKYSNSPQLMTSDLGKIIVKTDNLKKTFADHVKIFVLQVWFRGKISRISSRS